MKKGTKKDIVEILMAIYKIPGQYVIGGIIAIAFWKAMKDLTKWSILLLILGIFLFSLEVVSPILAGKRLYEKFVKWLK